MPFPFWASLYDTWNISFWKLVGVCLYAVASMSLVPFPAGSRDFSLSSKTSRQALGNTQPPIPWVMRAISMGFTGQRWEAYYSTPGKEFVEIHLQYPISHHGYALRHLPQLIFFKNNFLYFNFTTIASIFFSLSLVLKVFVIVSIWTWAALLSSLSHFLPQQGDRDVWNYSLYRIS